MVLTCFLDAYWPFLYALLFSLILVVISIISSSTTFRNPLACWGFSIFIPCGMDMGMMKCPLFLIALSSLSIMKMVFTSSKCCIMSLM